MLSRPVPRLAPALLLPSLFLLGPLALGGCSSAPDPVTRVAGSKNSIASIAGDWEGDYRLSDGSRRGNISFHLLPGDSVASGRVLMRPPTEVETPVGGEAAHAPQELRPMQPLEVTFVAVENDRLRGTLMPYIDPDCSCEVHTTFDGTLTGDLIEGTFVIRNLVDGRNRTGRWSVRRQTSK